MRVSTAALLAIVLAVAAGAAVAHADPPDGPEEPASAPERDGPPRNYGNLRIGASTANENGRPELCLELAPLAFLSVEGCGTGSGFLHRDPEAELAHFGVKLRAASIETDFAWLEPNIGVGFAELQVGADDPGFRFDSTGPRGIETAGPEIGASLRALVEIAEGFEGVLEARFALAYLPEAPHLVRPFPELMPSAEITLGAGF